MSIRQASYSSKIYFSDGPSFSSSEDAPAMISAEAEALIERCLELLKHKIPIRQLDIWRVCRDIGGNRELFQSMLEKEFRSKTHRYWLLRIYDAYHRKSDPFAAYLDLMVDNDKISAKAAHKIMCNVDTNPNEYQLTQFLLGIIELSLSQKDEILEAYNFFTNKSFIDSMQERHQFQVFDFLLKEITGMGPPKFHIENMLVRHFLGFPNAFPEDMRQSVSAHFPLSPLEIFQAERLYLSSKTIKAFVVALLNSSFDLRLRSRLEHLYRMSYSNQLDINILRMEKTGGVFEQALRLFILNDDGAPCRLLERQNVGETSKEKIRKVIRLNFIEAEEGMPSTSSSKKAPHRRDF